MTDRGRRPELVIEGLPHVPLVSALRELWAFRATLRAFTERNIRVRYKQAALGVAWAVLQPLTFMAVFTLVLGRLAGVTGGGTPYAVFSLSALVPWMFLQTAVTFGANSLLADAHIIRRVYLPREAPVLGAVLATGVDLAIGLVLFAILGPWLGARPSPAWLLAPLLAVVLGILAAGVGCAVAALTVHYRDFRHALPFLLQFWLFASPVAYPLSVVPEAWQGVYVALNPAAGILDAFRSVLAQGQPPSASLVLTSLASSVVLALLGYRLFKNLEPTFSDVV